MSKFLAGGFSADSSLPSLPPNPTQLAKTLETNQNTQNMKMIPAYQPYCGTKGNFLKSGCVPQNVVDNIYCPKTKSDNFLNYESPLTY